MRRSQGSSPLTRGKLRDRQARDDSAGLIPAHAGKTRARCAAGWRRRAHPRSRGENVAPPNAPPTPRGSSPLTRGKPLLTRSSNQTHRLIPAHAGKTQRAVRHGGEGRAHPRSRGENAAHFSSGREESGSSPLTRGKPMGAGVSTSARRLIPAHAGKTSMSAESLGPRKAHPRSRGENFRPQWRDT